MSQSTREFRNFLLFLPLTPNGCFTVANFSLNLFQIEDTEETQIKNMEKKKAVSNENLQLERGIGKMAAIMLCFNGIVGSGIFVSPKGNFLLKMKVI